MKTLVLTGSGLALGIAFLVYAAIGETGPIGWLNAGQLWAFGAYSRKMSLLALMCIGTALFAAAVWVWSWFDDAAGPRARSAPLATAAPRQLDAKPLPWALGCGIGFVVAMALVWAAAYGYVWWDLRQRSADSLAEYEPLELTAGVQSPGQAREHLALRGRVLGDHVVSRTSGSSTESWQTLVPVVERGWREGDAVHFVIRLDKNGPAALREALRTSDALLVRADGSVPTPALQVFEKMKSPIAADAVAVMLVATQDGRPAPVRQELDWSDAIVWAVVGSFAVTLGTLFMLAIPWSQRRQERKLLTQRQRAARRAAR